MLLIDNILIKFWIVECLTGLSIDGAEYILTLSFLCISGDEVLHVLIRVGSDLLKRVLGACGCICLKDLFAVVIEIEGHLVVDRLVPIFLDLLQFEQGFLLLLLKNVVALVPQNLLNICERPGDDIYEEVIHDVSVISLVRISCWSSVGIKLNNSCIQFDFILVFLLKTALFSLDLLFVGVGQDSLFVIFKKNIDVVVKLYIHLDIEEYVEIT